MDFAETFSICKIRGIFGDKNSASLFLIHSEQDFDYAVSWLSRSCSSFSYSYDTKRKLSFSQTIFHFIFLPVWLYLKLFAEKKWYLSVLSQYVHNLGWRVHKRQSLILKSRLSWQSSWKHYGLQRFCVVFELSQVTGCGLMSIQCFLQCLVLQYLL